MTGLRVKLAIGIAVAGVGVTGAAAMAGGHRHIETTLSGYEETPLALSTTGNGSFTARIQHGGGSIAYELEYAELEGSVTQAHIHFGAKAQTGGVSVFLCSNLGNGPAGTQPCPPAPARVTGTIEPDDVIGPAAQGISAGEFDELLQAIRAGVAYANVHSTLYPGGEIRGQFDDHEHHDD
jgi:hypothetical protein